MSTAGSTQSVLAGAATATVLAALPSSYQVGISPSWVTDYDVITKTAGGFVVNFSVPCPVGGGTFDWVAQSGTATTTLASGSTAVGAGLATVTVPAGAFSSTNFLVSVAPNWVTGWEVIAKTLTGFTVMFAVAAPVGGGSIDWIVVSLSPSALGVGTQPVTGATQAVAAGVTLGAVTGGFGTVYQVTVAPSWVTGYDVVSKTSAGFTVNFAVPAPAGGGTFDWIVWSPGSGFVTLSDYLQSLRDLLRDPNDDLWSSAQKTRFINDALKRRDFDTEGNRQLISFGLTAGTDTYTFANLGNNRVFDVIGINLIFVAQRIVLAHLSFTELNQRFRPWVPWTDIPRAFARYGPSTVVFGPSPGFAYTSEWDCAIYGNPLVNLTDTDVLPIPYTVPVPFYAAHLAKLNERQWDEADDFFRQYREQIDTAINARVGMDPQVARI